MLGEHLIDGVKAFPFERFSAKESEDQADLKTVLRDNTRI